MRPGGVDVSEIRYVPTDVFPAIKNYRIFLGDIFISVAGTLGIVGKIPPALDGANLTENADRITDIRCDRDYLLYSLTSDRIQRLIDSSRTVGAQPKLALGRIESFVIPLPPTDVEQRAIAAALADVDALLTKLDQLIAKKRDLKQAAMQQLLTGRTRLEGFAAPWQQIQMGRLGSFSKGRGLAKEDLARGGELAAVPYTAIYTDFGQIASMIDVAGRVSRSRAEVTVNRPSLLIASSSNMLENIGKAVALCIDDDVAVGGDVLIFRTQADVRFLSYLLSTEAHRRRVVALSQGSTIRHVYAATFSAYEVELPSREEQAAIADVLSDIDAELVALEARRNKTRQLKQGMMQSLLTGRIRLV
jgi:type I restriction enzyme S subunit